MRTDNLRIARQAKNDEFYTRYEDIEAEVSLYADLFRGKWVYCNCDTPDSSFWQFFYDNYSKLQLMHLSITSLDGFRVDYDGLEVVKMKLHGDCWFSAGDFRSQECLRLLDDCDICVTNPPFSIFRTYFQTLQNASTKFLMLAPLNAVSYKVVFPHLMAGDCFVGGHNVTEFKNTDKKVGCRWLTNLRRPAKPKLPCDKVEPGDGFIYNATQKIKNINKCADIAGEPGEVLAVPVSLFDYDYSGFKILGISSLMDCGAGQFLRHLTAAEKLRAISHEDKIPDRTTTLWIEDGSGNLKQIYNRIFIIKEAQ